MPDFSMTDRLASFRFSHHIAGSCSAQPGLAAWIGISLFGKKSDATISPVSAFTRHAFTDELPISYPNKYMIFLLYSLIK
jgi:hypothetical protein